MYIKCLLIPLTVAFPGQLMLVLDFLITFLPDCSRMLLNLSHLSKGFGSRFTSFLFPIETGNH